MNIEPLLTRVNEDIQEKLVLCLDEERPENVQKGVASYVLHIQGFGVGLVMQQPEHVNGRPPGCDMPYGLAKHVASAFK